MSSFIKKILNLVLKSLYNDLVQEMKNAFFNLFIFKKDGSKILPSFILVGYQKGKHKEQVKTMKGTLENVQKAKTIRDNVVDIDRIRRLHNKYKR